MSCTVWGEITYFILHIIKDINTYAGIEVNPH